MSSVDDIPCTCGALTMDRLTGQARLQHHPGCDVMTAMYSHAFAEAKRAELARAVDMATGERAHPLRLVTDTERTPPPTDDDRAETADRARGVSCALESCHEELTRLELIPTQDADDINALSAAKGLIARARNILRGRFQ